MKEKVSVTVPLTVRQKDQIKRATGRSFGGLKVEAAPGMRVGHRTLTKIQLTRPGGGKGPLLPG